METANVGSSGSLLLVKSMWWLCTVLIGMLCAISGLVSLVRSYQFVTYRRDVDVNGMFVWLRTAASFHQRLISLRPRQSARANGINTSLVWREALFHTGPGRARHIFRTLETRTG